MVLSKDSETECVTTQGGGRVAIPVGGSLTGRGFDVIIIDDPMKADDAQSEKARRALIEWYTTTLLSRLTTSKAAPSSLSCKRLHEDDLAGKLLRDGGWRHLNLPAIAEIDEDVAIGPNAVHQRRNSQKQCRQCRSSAILDRFSVTRSMSVARAQPGDSRPRKGPP